MRQLPSPGCCLLLMSSEDPARSYPGQQNFRCCLACPSGSASRGRQLPPDQDPAGEAMRGSSVSNQRPSDCFARSQCIFAGQRRGRYWQKRCSCSDDGRSIPMNRNRVGAWSPRQGEPVRWTAAATGRAGSWREMGTRNPSSPRQASEDRKREHNAGRGCMARGRMVLGGSAR